MRQSSFVMAAAACVGLLAAPASLVRAQAAGAPPAAARPTDAELQAITDGGKRIAAYHEAVARCRAALAQRQPDLGEAPGVMVERNGVMHVFLLRREEVGKDTRGLVAVADATWQPRAGEVASLVLLDQSKSPPADVIGHLRALAAARSAAAARAGGPPAPYDEAVFREKGAVAYVVYLQTRPDRTDAARFGSDLKLRLSGDGMQVGEMLPLHDATSLVAVPERPGASPTLHSHAQGDLPTETDVAVVLDHPALAPHLVLTPRHMFRIESDGRILWLGPNTVRPAAPGGP
ncbi:MAG TPA: hypothetical protein VFD06_07695 [Candidatus Polarisedimenticolia bacterium]|nr:hypothetical protein [Candidatus Polarisedimenticolia bacterium]